MKVELLKWHGFQSGDTSGFSYGIYRVGIRKPLVFVADHPAHALQLYRRVRYYDRKSRLADTPKQEVDT